MNPMNFVWGGAAIGAITACWGYIKAVLWKICNLAVQQVEIHDEACADSVISYLVKHYRRSGLYDRTYGATNEHMRSGKFGQVAFERFGRRSVIFWNRLFPFFFHGPEKKQQQSNNGTNNNNDKKEVFAYITFVRGTLDIDRIIEQAVRERNEMNWSHNESQSSNVKRFFIKHIPDINKDKNSTAASTTSGWYNMPQFRLLGHKPEDLGRKVEDGRSSLDNLIFPERVRELVKEIQLWRKNKDWYVRRGIPWKRGWLLYGPPGTGKTALARAFAEDLDMPIYVFNLAEVMNHELMRAWIEMQQNVPCIALIEDIDNVFHGRENVSLGRRGIWSMFRRKEKSNSNNSNTGDDKEEHGGGMLNFDVFLNCLDGVERSDGIFTIITTNDISKIDEALGRPRTLPDGTVEFISTRPGRIDKAIELTYMEPQDKRRMAHKILDEYQDALREMLEFVDKFPDLKETPAQFQERCAQIALRCFWREVEAAEAAKAEVHGGPRRIAIVPSRNGRAVKPAGALCSDT